MSDWHMKGTQNKVKKGHEKKTTVDKRVLTRKVCDVLAKRLADDPELSGVSDETLLKFLQAVTPKEVNTKHDASITYITSTPRPTIEHNTPVIDITSLISIQLIPISPSCLVYFLL